MLNFLKNIKIKTRLYIWVGGLIVFLMTILFANYSYVGELKNAFEEVEEENNELYAVIDTLTAINRVNIATHDYWVVGITPERRARLDELYLDVFKKMEILEFYSANLPNEEISFKKLKADFLIFEKKGGEVLNLLQNGGISAEQGEVMMAELDGIIERIREEIDIWREFGIAEVEETGKEVLEIQTALVRVNLSVVTFLLCVSVLFAIILSRLIGRSVENLLEAARKISAGELSARAKIESMDELGELASVFNKMASDLENAKMRQEKDKEKMEKNMHQMDVVNKAMIGRELTIVELKKKIKELESAPSPLGEGRGEAKT